MTLSKFVLVSERERGGGRACIFVLLYASGLHNVEKSVLKLLAAVQIFCSQVFWWEFSPMSGIKTTARSESSLNVILSSTVLFNQCFLNLLGDKPWQLLRCFLDIGSKPCCLNEVYRSTGVFSHNSLLVCAGCIDSDRPLAIMVLVTTLPPDTTHYVPVFLARWAFRFYLWICESSSASPQEEVAVIWSRPPLFMMYRRWDLLSESRNRTTQPIQTRCWFSLLHQ